MNIVQAKMMQNGKIRIASTEDHVEIGSDLHARIAAGLIQIAKGFKSDIKICVGDKCANAKSLMSVMILGAVSGDDVVVKADGEDEQEAIAAIVDFLKSNLA